MKVLYSGEALTVMTFLRRRASRSLKGTAEGCKGKGQKKLDEVFYSAKNTYYCIIIMQIQIKQSPGKPLRNKRKPMHLRSHTYKVRLL